MKYYAIHKGRESGIYNTWDECKELVNGFKGAKYKKFNNLNDARYYIDNGFEKDNDISTIVSAPTSSCKSVISGYSFTKGKTLVVVPSDPLAWQMATYIGNILDKSIPIITKSYQTSPKRDELIEIVNKSNALVGTADASLDFLPLSNVEYDWIV